MADDRVLLIKDLAQFHGRRQLRCFRGQQINLLLEGDEAYESFTSLFREATEDYLQLPWLLVQQSRMVH